MRRSAVITLIYSALLSHAISVPATPPTSAASIDPALLSISIEFFAFPGYTQLRATENCLDNIAELRGGAQPAIRIGGTTQYVPTKNFELANAYDGHSSLGTEPRLTLPYYQL